MAALILVSAHRYTSSLVDHVLAQAAESIVLSSMLIAL